MIHMTHPESHEYFHNALIIGAPQVKFWNASEAATAYGFISKYSGCTTAETMAEDLADGSWLTCLKNIPLANFQALCTGTADIFKGIALDSNHLSQVDQLFAMNVDGEIVTHDPRDAIKANSADVKSDMGFYLHELSQNEGMSMTQNLFSNVDFKKMMFGDHYANIFETYPNSHIVVPKAAHDGLMTQMYSAAGDDFMNNLLGDGALGCPANADDPTGPFGLFTECKDKTADWVTSWLWHCNTRDFLMPRFSQNENMYSIDFAAAYPGPDHGQTGVLLPDTAGVNDCYEAGREKSCHIVGQAYLFGEADIQGIDQTDEQKAFGLRYRTLYSDLIKNGHQSEFSTFAALQGNYNLMDIGEEVTMSTPHGVTCHMFDMIQSYGMI